VFVSGILVLLEFCGPERRPTYAGIANTAVGVAAIAGPLLATWLAGIGYRWLFAVSAVVGLAAWIAMRWLVQEPRKAEGRGSVAG
jgi:MFS family permease